MTASPGAVLLSYASEDAPAALLPCEDQRAAGIEVWLDQSALRGGDAWDAAVQKRSSSVWIIGSELLEDLGSRLGLQEAPLSVHGDR